MGTISKHPHLNNSMMSYEKLIAAIEKLENDGIVNFNEFEKLPFYEIRKQYFSVPNPTMMEKAKIIIRDKRNGKEELSEYKTVTEFYDENGKVTKTISKTQYF